MSARREPSHATPECVAQTPSRARRVPTLPLHEVALRAMRRHSRASRSCDGGNGEEAAILPGFWWGGAEAGGYRVFGVRGEKMLFDGEVQRKEHIS